MDETDHGLTPRIADLKVNRKVNEINDLPTPPQQGDLMSSTPNPGNLGHRIPGGRVDTNYHDQGNGHPVVMIHGSGPGVTAWG